MKLLILLILTSLSLILVPYYRNKVFGESHNRDYQTANTSINNLPIKNVTLIARERKQDFFSGQSSPANRDIGLASVFLRLENAHQENIRIVIEKIEVRYVDNDKAELVTTAPQEIILKPLENSENTFDLTNKVGFTGRGKVKAVVTYQSGNFQGFIESPAVEIDRL